MSKRKEKTFFPVLSLLLMVLFFSTIFLSAKSDTEREGETGEIRVNNKTYKYAKRSDSVNIYDSQSHLVFSSSCENDNSVILNFGFSQAFNSFFTFKEKIDFQPLRYGLSLEFEHFTIPVILNSPSAFYTPLLVEKNDNIYLIYISEDFSIRVHDLQQNQLLHKIKSPTPVIKLALGKIHDRDIVEFYRFVNGKYWKHFFYIEDIETNRINFFPFETDETKETGSVKSEMSLDYKKFIGFGDSITYGEIENEPAPEKGYIPRLQPLLNDQLYKGAEVINEGIGGTQTWQAVNRIEPVILKHMGKYLLFHYGTNDVVHLEIPTSTVVFNIEYMIEKTLEYGVQPILTTLIPRNGRRQEELHRQRGLIVSEGIIELAQSLDIPVIDLWNIFFYYPDSDGGYMSLMSDGVHPSEKGYQLMAEEWLEALLGLPPLAPTGVSILNRSRNQITVQWSENIELDVVQYLIKFGYSPARLTRTITTSTAYYVFKYNPLFSPFNRRVYFQVQALDNSGHASEFSPLQQAEFNTTDNSTLNIKALFSLPTFVQL